MLFTPSAKKSFCSIDFVCFTKSVRFVTSYRLIIMFFLPKQCRTDIVTLYNPLHFWNFCFCDAGISFLTFNCDSILPFFSSWNLTRRRIRHSDNFIYLTLSCLICAMRVLYLLQYFETTLFFATNWRSRDNWKLNLNKFLSLMIRYGSTLWPFIWYWSRWSCMTSDKKISFDQKKS